MGINSSKFKVVDGDKSKRQRTKKENKLGNGEVPNEGNSEKKEYSKFNKLEAERLDDDSLLIFKNELVRGVIDKAQFGDYGLVHTVQELYGSNTAGLLLSVMSRLFTVYLQVMFTGSNYYSPSYIKWQILVHNWYYKLPLLILARSIFHYSDAWVHMWCRWSFAAKVYGQREREATPNLRANWWRGSSWIS